MGWLGHPLQHQQDLIEIVGVGVRVRSLPFCACFACDIRAVDEPEPDRMRQECGRASFYSKDASLGKGGAGVEEPLHVQRADVAQANRPQQRIEVVVEQVLIKLCRAGSRQKIPRQSADGSSFRHSTANLLLRWIGSLSSRCGRWVMSATINRI